MGNLINNKVKSLIIVIVTLMLIITTASACTTSPNIMEKPRTTINPDRICEAIVLNQKTRDMCIVRITQLIMSKALFMKKLDTHTMGIKFQSTDNWNVQGLGVEEILGVVAAILIINPDIKHIIMGIETVPLFDFTYDGDQLCTTLIRSN